MTPFLALLLFLTWPQGDTIPPINARIVAYVLAHEGQQVDRGECWDLAAHALNHAEAKWDGQFGFGRAYDPEREQILPGDIIQFEKVTLEERTPNGMQRASFPKHTAVVISVPATGKVTIAHQNFGETGRKVSRWQMDLTTTTRGKLLFFRPVP